MTNKCEEHWTVHCMIYLSFQEVLYVLKSNPVGATNKMYMKINVLSCFG